MKKYIPLLLLVLCTISFKGFSVVKVGNIVWNDANGNGIKEVFEHGVGGVTVKLYTDNNGNNDPDGAGFGTVIATTTSAADGSYSFSNLPDGRYIAGLIIPTGFTISPTHSLTPDDNINNDNNAAIVYNNQAEIRSNAITLTTGGEPTTDGDGSSGNLTLDLAICGRSDIGDYVWFDRNANGIQEDSETGFANVSVTLTYPDGTTYQKFTDQFGKYLFINLGPGSHSLKFETPVGFTPSPALVGSDRQKDSDPIGGTVSLNVLANTANLSYDAGFYKVVCTSSNDTDKDCVADTDDLDDDNDGIIDDVENGGYDALKDCDNDGIINFRDPTPGCAPRTGTNVYGLPYLPLTWTDCNSDGINDFFDWDRDGIINELDLDSDNDGIIDIQESRDVRIKDNNMDGMADGIDQDGDGILSSADVNDLLYGGPGLMPEDLDRDGLPNYLDLDSDGDGLSDIAEAILLIDSDGLANGTDSDKDGALSVIYTNNDNAADNFNGFGAKGIKVADSDNDGFPNPYDIDSDNDGITDNVEAQPTCNEVQPSGVDTDKDGLDDVYDVNLNACRHSAHGITPYDKDADGTPDIYDLDTDNDGSPDENEGSGIYGNFVTNFNDTDGDGLIDQFDIFNIKTAIANFINNVAHSNMGPNGNLDGPIPAGSNPELPQSKPGNCASGVDRDWREISILPVNLVDFKGTLTGNSVQLVWTTASEQNMKQFIVERSDDAQTFKAVGSKVAKGNSAIATHYNLQDDVSNVVSKFAYYRLRQIDNSLVSKVSSIVKISLDKKNAYFTLYPNPVKNNFTVKLVAAKDGLVNVRIADLYGRIVQVRNNRIFAGSNTINFDGMNKLAAGNYVITVMVDGVTSSKKLVIAR